MKLTKAEAKAIIGVSKGADIYGYGTAKTLRAMETRGFVEITKAMMATGDGSGQEPYFGAIATKAGILAARKVMSS
jgi:hypothetical protein